MISIRQFTAAPTSGRAKVLGIRLGYAAKSFGLSAATNRSENSLTTTGSFRDTVFGGQAGVANVRLSAAPPSEAVAIHGHGPQLAGGIER